MWPNFTSYIKNMLSSPRRRGTSPYVYYRYQKLFALFPGKLVNVAGRNVCSRVRTCAGTTRSGRAGFALVFTAAILAGCASAPQQETSRAPAPDNPAPAVNPPSENVEQDFRSALALMQDEDWQTAADRLGAITAAAPQLAGAWVNLGIVRVKLGDSSGAEQAFKKALEINSRHAEAWNQLGMVYRRSGRLGDAQFSYNEALKHDPRHANAHWNLAILHDSYLPDPALALTHYENYQQLTRSDDAQLQQWIAGLREQLPKAVEMTAGVAK